MLVRSTLSAIALLIAVCAFAAVVSRSGPSPAAADHGTGLPHLTVLKICEPISQDTQTFTIQVVLAADADVVIGAVTLPCGEQGEIGVQWDIAYRLVEVADPADGYPDTPTIGGFCSAVDGSFEFDQGDDDDVATCSVTNVRDPRPQLRIQKLCDPADVLGTFVVQVVDIDDNVLHEVGIECGATSIPLIVEPNTQYQLVEPGYAPTFGGNCGDDGSFVLGDEQFNGTCTVANAFSAAPRVTVEKLCIPTDLDGVFTMDVYADSELNPITTFDLACGETSAPLPLQTGVTYTVIEDAPDGYANAAWGGLCTQTVQENGETSGQFSFDPDDEVLTGTCTVTNTLDETPTVRLQKVCIPGDLEGEFTISLLDGDAEVASYDLECGETSPAIAIDFDTEYTVVEEVRAGYPPPEWGNLCAADGQGAGRFTIPAGAEVVAGICSVSNEPPTLVIQKLCTPPANNAFTISVAARSGEQPTRTISLNCGESSAPLPVVPNIVYEVREDPGPGYQPPLYDAGCDERGRVTLSGSDTAVTCIVINRRGPPPRSTEPSSGGGGSTTPTPTPTSLATSTPGPTATATATATATPLAQATALAPAPTSAAASAGAPPRVTPVPPRTGSAGLEGGGGVPWALLALVVLGAPAVVLVRRRG